MTRAYLVAAWTAGIFALSALTLCFTMILIRVIEHA